RSRASARSRVSRRASRREVGSGERRGDVGRSPAPRAGADRRIGGRGTIVKIRSVRHDNRRKGFEVRTSRARLWLPYAKLEVRPTPHDPIVREYVDPELGNEGFTYLLKSGDEGTVHIEQVLEYNQDPDYLRDLLLYKLTIEARKRLAKTRLSRREIIRRLAT